MYPILITYHLTASPEHYNEFFDAINDIEPNKCIELFDGCQIVTTILTPIAIREMLIPYLNQSDRLFVCKFRHDECVGQLPKLKKRWIKENVMDKAPSDPYADPRNMHLKQLRK